MSGISLPARLLRGFAVDFLTSHDPAVAREILTDDYRLSISGHLFEGRDDSYLPATVSQLDQFPGLCVTVHDVVLGPDAVALRFTEHGAAANSGVVSTWGGVTMFRLSDGRLEHGWAEEDYFARKRQLKSGQADAIAVPHAAPWDRPLEQPDAATESTMREWLGKPASLFAGIEEISALGPSIAELIEPDEIDVSFLFSAGNRAAFHGVVSGRYAGGFTDVAPERIGDRISLPIAAIIDTGGSGIERVQLCGDRLGLNRSLLSPR